MKIAWTIEFDQATGQVGINGPIQDKILTLGVLELVKGVVLMQEGQPAKPPIAIAQFLPNGNGHGGF